MGIKRKLMRSDVSPSHRAVRLPLGAALLKTQHSEEVPVGHVLRFRTGYVKHRWRDSNQDLGDTSPNLKLHHAK